MRISVEPTSQNGLRRPSQMVDKIQTVSRKRIGSRVGRLEDETLLAVNRAIALILGLAE
jgi:mRNA interferase MazF